MMVELENSAPFVLWHLRITSLHCIIIIFLFFSERDPTKCSVGFLSLGFLILSLEKCFSFIFKNWKFWGKIKLRYKSYNTGKITVIQQNDEEKISDEPTPHKDHDSHTTYN